MYWWICPPIPGWSFYFVDVFLCCAKTFLFGVVPFVYFFLCFLAWEDVPNKILLQAMSKILLSMFSSRMFIFWSLIFKSLTHFQFILMCGVRRWSSFIFLHVSVQFSQHHLLNKLSLPLAGACFLCWILIDYKGVGLFLHILFFLKQLWMGLFT